MLDSSTKKTFALFTSERLSAKENMLIDKELFNGFNALSTPIFRVYEWEESFTYGFSQKISTIKNLNHLSKHKQNYAKRITGGGILFHGNDISYSLIIPTSFVKNLSVKQSYELLCSFLIEFYKSLGLNPSYAKYLEDINLSKSDYCQEGFEPYDILVDGKKIGGNAQRRSKDTIFQHGSICIDNSAYSIGNSLEDLGVKVSFKEAKELLVKSFTNTFSVVFEEKNKDVIHAS
ncbi:MAG: ligase [Sulfurovum sp.]|nr:MAG: ligase [Sulfurovum sp.]